MLKKELLRLEEEMGDPNLGQLLFDIMRRHCKMKKRSKLLTTLLTYSNVNINERAPNGMTALHYAVKVRDITGHGRTDLH